MHRSTVLPSSIFRIASEGPILRDDEIRYKSTAYLSLGHIGTDEWTWAPFLATNKSCKIIEQFQLVSHQYIGKTIVQWKDKQHWLADQLNQPR